MGLAGRIKRKLLGEKPVRPVTMHRPTERLGSAYGGWVVLPEQLDEHSVVYSAGVGEDTSFDEALIERFGCRVHAIDPTPKAHAHIERRRAAGKLDERFSCLPYALGAEDGRAVFRLPANEEHVSGSMESDAAGLGERTLEVEVRSLASIARELGHERIDLLKVDIEGSEYQLIEGFCREPMPVAQFLFEVHPQMFEDGRARTERAVGALCGLGYEVFAVSKLAMEYHLSRPDLLR